MNFNKSSSSSNIKLHSKLAIEELSKT